MYVEFFFFPILEHTRRSSLYCIRVTETYSCKIVKWETLQSAAGIHWCYAASVPLRLCITCWGGRGGVGMVSKCTCFLRSGKRTWGHMANGLVRCSCLFFHYEWYGKPFYHLFPLTNHLTYIIMRLMLLIKLFVIILASKYTSVNITNWILYGLYL